MAAQVRPRYFAGGRKEVAPFRNLDGVRITAGLVRRQARLVVVMDIFTIKALRENYPKMEAIALTLLNCLHGEMPKTVRQEIRGRKRLEKMYEKLYRKKKPIAQ